MPRCPVCDAAVSLDQTPTAPFCSDRCRLVDLGRWLGGHYAIPAEEPLGEADLEAIISNDNAPRPCRRRRVGAARGRSRLTP